MLNSMLGPILLLTLFLTAAPVFAADDVTFLVAGGLIDTLEGKRVANPVVEISGNQRKALQSTGDEEQVLRLSTTEAEKLRGEVAHRRETPFDVEIPLFDFM